MKDKIEEALAEYLVACYGDAPLHKAQAKEVRQAFLSGIHWRDTEILPPGACEAALRNLLSIQSDRN